ncbi:MAG: hypothetical protein GYB68_12445 [Chloroflexi bacterium]|nr:hypothetical protein [Chloroflexota bacterium]
MTGQDDLQYMIEAIVAPEAFVVAGFGNVMPQNFGEQMTSEELGDIIAYLLEQ